MNDKNIVELINKSPNNIKIGKGKIDIISAVQFFNLKEMENQNVSNE